MGDYDDRFLCIFTSPFLWRESGIAPGHGEDTVATMSTRMLILASLLCGLAILVAFTVQIMIAS